MEIQKINIGLTTLYLALSLVICDTVNAATRADFYASFDPIAGVIPYPNNVLFNGSTDGTLNLPVADPHNLADPQVALNALDGFSTVAPLTAQFSGSINANTLQAGHTVRVFAVELANPFLDAATPAPFAVTAVQHELRAGVDYQVNLSPQDAHRTTLNIHPLLPLKPNTGYLVLLTNGIQDRDGYHALPSPTYALTQQTTPLVDAIGQSVIPSLSDAQAQTLEPLRQQVNSQEEAAARQGVVRENIVLSWTFTTQSIDAAFRALGETLQPIGMVVQATGATTATVGLGLPGFSDIYTGALATPYYLSKDQPLNGYWQTADDRAVTRYHPLPVATATLQIPVLMTVPSASSGHRQPLHGWPVVIFQHGITKDRTNLLALADALSFAGYAAVAIDLPLHGITDTTHPFYMKGLERTFDLDLIDNQTQLPTADGQIDPSGNYFINLKSLLTTRDNARQAAQDLRQLTATLPQVDLDGDRHPDLDVSQMHFVGHSLGAITGATFLGIEDHVISGTLAMGGGGLAKLLDGSATFGPVIANGLASAGLTRGTLAYESFLNAAQTVADAGDPINYASAAARLHPIHLIEVVGSAGALPDQVVPNRVENAPLAGTEPLAQIMGLQTAHRSVSEPQGVRAIVRFTEGDHGSILSPIASVGATAEMQGQMIHFLNSAGTVLEIIYRPVVQ